MGPIRSIIVSVSQKTGVPVAAILSKSRIPEVVRARHSAMFEARRLGNSTPKIGQIFHRHHSSVGHAVKKESARLALEKSHETR